MKVRFAFVAVVAAAVLAGAFAPTGHGLGPNAVVTPSCAMSVLDRNDDGSTSLVPIGFSIDFFGQTYSSLYVNNNGNVTFDRSMSTYTPFELTTTSEKIIAAYFGDVDTRNPDSGVLTYGVCTFEGRDAFFANWDGVGVGYYSAAADKLNSFQLVIQDRSDTGAGNFDIILNYDQIQWESGDASGGTDGLGGSPARVGFSNGVDTSFEMPGSGVSGAFLDTNTATGLIHGSLNAGGQLGRYRFAVRNGAIPSGHTISGAVYQGSVAAGNEVAGALVSVCDASGFCNLTTTGSAGGYAVGGLANGDYTATAFPPGDLDPGQIGPLTVADGDLAGQDIVVTGPTAPPSGTSIDDDTPPGAIPSVVVGRPVHLETTGCDGGSATYTVTGEYGGSVGGSMTEGPAGTYTADFTIPFTGPAVVTIVIAGCPTIEFDIYIDPSGFVRTPGGNPIEGATVTLFRSNTGLEGTFFPVPDGSSIMSPSNRTNPDLTDATGHFGWDVIAGFYVVRAEKADCHAVGDPSQAFVETAVLPVPPIWLDLDLRLEGPGCPESLGAGPLLDALLADVIGVGPGKSLENKVRSARAAFEAGDTTLACETLTGFRNEVRAQSGKKVPATLADGLRADAAAIMTELGC